MPELQRILHDGVLLPFQDMPLLREEIQGPEDDQGKREVPGDPPQAIRLHRPVPAEEYFRLYRKPLLNALFKSVEDAFNALLKNHAPTAYKVIHVEFPDVVSLVDAAFENEVQSMRIWIAIGVEAPDDDLVDCGLEYLPLEHANPLLQSKTYR